MTKKRNQTLRFASQVPQEEDRVYFFRMNGCGHCESVKEIWPQVVRIIAVSRPSVKMIEVESKDKDKLLDKYAKEKLKSKDINAYPDLRILKKNGATLTFNSERTIPALVAWIESNVTAFPKRIPTPHPNKSKKAISHAGGGGGGRRRTQGRRQASRPRRRTRRC
jgi:hypothetical protein